MTSTGHGRCRLPRSALVRVRHLKTRHHSPSRYRPWVAAACVSPLLRVFTMKLSFSTCFFPRSVYHDFSGVLRPSVPQTVE